jgi:hypothetical protein
MDGCIDVLVCVGGCALTLGHTHSEVDSNTLPYVLKVQVSEFSLLMFLSIKIEEFYTKKSRLLLSISSLMTLVTRRSTWAGAWCMVPLRLGDGRTDNVSGLRKKHYLKGSLNFEVTQSMLACTRVSCMTTLLEAPQVCSPQSVRRASRLLRA